MNLNAVLMKFFNLPPAMKMLLAVAGFGSLASILFWVLPALKTPQARMWILIVGGIGVVAFLIVVGVRRLFFTRKSQQLSSALASQGPTRGDIAEQEQLYREKFNAKLNELRANGLSVYKLPWFVLMGEPGCGKTASLIHSGLDFPLGKDEVPGFGGTRNYNWWFTNEAVILDTAGRIAFQEEGTTDKIEWEYFLKLLKRNRPRCPINGVIVAIPADKLLRDSAEERATKAAILRERLRQIHQQLGVRFPTFVLVTKMDLVGGFSEFCEEIRVDLHQRNQMFGWSRPGEFQEPYDPASFPEAFQQLYARVRDWALYYMHKRRATEQELGMVVTFPESFRQLGVGLADYIGTIFQKSPLLEPPFFRGAYFTSAVQEGAPIFDVFTRTRAGHAITERPRRAVDSKAFFIHDFYAKKVFPENGLVFRSAKHVALNRRARRLVWVGSAALCALMLTFFGFGYYGVRGLVRNPRETVEAAVRQIEKGEADMSSLAANLAVAQSLKRHIDAYNSPWSGLFARMLFLGANISEPRSYVQTVHARFVLDCILRPIVRAAEERMQMASLPPAGPERDSYLAALATYARWYGELAGQYNLPLLDPEFGEARKRSAEFNALMGAIPIGQKDREEAAGQLQAALESFSRALRGQATFARDVLGSAARFVHADMGVRLKVAIENLEKNWEPQARIAAGSARSEVQYWAQFAARLQKLRDAYLAALATAALFRQPDTFAAGWTEFDRITRRVAALKDETATIPPDAGELTQAFSELRSFLKNTPAPQDSSKRIIRLTGLAELISRLWSGEFQKIEAELGAGAPRDKGAAAEVYAALDAARGNLNKAVQASLTDLLVRLGLDDPNVDPLTHFSEAGLLTFKEATGPGFEGNASISLAPTALGENAVMVDYLTELARIADPNARDSLSLDDLRQWPDLIRGESAAAPAEPRLRQWFEGVAKAMQGQDEALRPTKKREYSALVRATFWQPEKLYDLADSMWNARRGLTVGGMLEAMAERARSAAAATEFRGVGQLMPGHMDPLPEQLPFQKTSFLDKPTVPAPPPEQPQKRPEPEADTLFGRPAQPARPADRPVELHREEPWILRRYHTRAFFWEALRAYVAAKQELAAQKERGRAALEALDRAAEAYVQQYFMDWNAVYSDPRKLLDPGMLALLADCRDGKIDWKAFHKALTGQRGERIGESTRRMVALAREVTHFGFAMDPNKPSDKSIQSLILECLPELRKRNANLPERLSDLRVAASGVQGTDPDQVLADRLAQVLGRYIDLVRAVGEDARGAPETLPTPEAIRKELADIIPWKTLQPESFPLIAPFLDLAAHGRDLLEYELRTQLRQRFQPLEGRYPVVADPFDASTDLKKLSDLGQKAADPKEFVRLLRDLAQFGRERADLIRKLLPDASHPVRQSLDLAAKWAAFLYEDPNSLATRDPEIIELTLGVAQPSDVTPAGAAYDKVVFDLPLIKRESLTPAESIERWVRPGAGGGEGQALPRDVADALSNDRLRLEFRWQLQLESEFKFAEPGAVVKERNERADTTKFPEEARTAWRIPARPIALLMLIDSRRENRREDGLICVVPARIQLRDEVIGFDVGIKFKRKYPGSLPPLPDPGGVPKMVRAETYLKAPE